MLSYPRTGSGWLSKLFETNNSVSLHEVYCLYPLNFFHTFKKINNIALKNYPSIQHAFAKMFFPWNFQNNNHKINQKILDIIKNENVYNYSLLQDLVNYFHSENTHVQFKIFPGHLDKDITLNNIDKITTHFILNYRENILNSYISEKLAKQSNVWFVTNDLEQKNELLQTYDTGILWDEADYQNYYAKTVSNFANLKSFFDSVDKPKLMISYEEIHDKENKIKFISSKLKSIGINDININIEDQYVKLNRIPETNIGEHFFNPEAFMQSLPNLKTHL